MSKGTTIKEALAKWEADTGLKASEAEHIKLIGQIPPIDKMDASLSTLTNCIKLSLSTNCIEKIANLNGLKNLRILSLGRNGIKNLNGLEVVADSLEELWISYNSIEKLKGIGVLKNLKGELPSLVDLLFVGNPLEEKHTSEGDWRDLAIAKLPKIKKLDGIPVVRQDEDEE
nr:dynein axonemal light chain 1 isoform X2 [Hydra vulgaris]